MVWYKSATNPEFYPGRPPDARRGARLQHRPPSTARQAERKLVARAQLGGRLCLPAAPAAIWLCLLRKLLSPPQQPAPLSQTTDRNGYNNRYH
ncbi:hypothetical protein GCM10027048_36540 [Hymenobacter coalescens]